MVQRLEPYALAAKVNEIRQLVPAVSRDHAEEEFKSNFRARRLTHLVGAVQYHMDIVQVRVVTAIVKNNPAILERGVAGVKESDLNSMIRYGINPRHKVLMYFKKQFLDSAPFHTVIFGIAHECSHLYLAAKKSRLAFDEQAVDICAMMLGFSQFYLKGHRYTPGWYSQISWMWSFGHSVGYLHEDDIRAVAAVLRKMRAHQ